MSIEKLTQIIVPPEYPIAPGTPEKWHEVETAIGTHLPTDYKALIDIYGQGWFKGLLSVLSPFAEGGWHERRSAFELMWAQQEMNDPTGEFRLKYPLFPEPGGLLLWGWDYNCGVMCWITEGNPNTWPTLSMDNKYSNWSSQRYKAPIVDLLCDWLSGGPTFRFYDSTEEDEEPQTVFFPGLESPWNL